MSKINLNDKYKPLFLSSSRYFIITGGRGSSKSFSVTTWVLLLMLVEKGHTILFTRYTMTSARLSIIPEFLEKIELLDLVDEFIITNDSIVNKATGSKVIFKGIKTSSGDQTASLKSLNGVTTWILDESEELTDEEIFDKINLSVRQKGIQNRVILLLNPATKEHWIYKRFFEDNGINPGTNDTKDNTTYIHTTYLDNRKHLDDSFIAEVENIKVNNPRKYDTVILGGWLDKSEGVVFTNWEIGEFNPDNLQTSFGQDYGFTIDPSTLVEVAIDKTKRLIYLKECFYDRNLTTSQIYELNCNRALGKLIIADSAEPRLIKELKDRGNNIKETKKGPDSIRAGIALMQDYKLIIEGNSINLIKELNNYAYSDRGSKLYIDNWNHLIDAARYNIYYQLTGATGKYSYGI